MMYQTILVPLDGSPMSERALPLASALAHSAGAQLVLLRAIGKPGLAGLDVGERQSEGLDEASRYLRPLADRLRQDGLQVETASPFEPAADAILAEIDIRHADLVVMCTHGRSGLSHLVFGSVAEAVVAHSRVPVLLVRAVWEKFTPSWPAEPRLLVPLDGSEFAEEALPHAVDMARALHGSLTLLQVVSPMPTATPTLTFPTFQWEVGPQPADVYQAAYDYLEHVAKRLRVESLPIETVVHTGSANEGVLAYCRYPGADMVVMATHGRTGLKRVMLGSVAFDVMQHGRAPVLLVRPEAMVEPALDDKVYMAN